MSIPQRAPELWVIRVSSRDPDALAGMVAQTVALFRPITGSDEIEALGTAPLLDQASIPASVQLQDRGTPGLKAVLFKAGPIYVLMAMGSAATGDGPGENAFVQLLNQTLRELRPVNLRVATLSRLVRHTDHVAAVQQGLLSYVENLHIGPTVLQFRGANASASILMWGVLSTVAAMERELIVQRLQAGLIGSFKRGEWLLGGRVQPLGYRFDPDSKRMHLDERQFDAVRLLWKTLASVREADQVITTMAASGLFLGERLSPEALLQMVNPNAWVETQLEYADCHRSGTHRLTYPNRFPGAREVNGVTIDYSDDEGGSLHLDYHWGRHDIDPELIDTAVALWSIKRPTGRSAATILPPLNGIQWHSEDANYLIRGYTKGQYEVRERPLDRTDQAWRTSKLLDGRRLGLVSAPELHQSMLEALEKAFREGIAGTPVDDVRVVHGLPGVPFMREEDVRRDRLTTLLSDARRKGTRARGLALDAPPEVQDDFLHDAAHFAREVARLEGELAQLEQRSADAHCPDSFDVSAEYLRAAARALGADQVDRASHDALQGLLVDMQILPTDQGFTWSTSLSIPAGGRVVQLGPISGTVSRIGRLAAGHASVSYQPVDPRTRKELIRRLKSAGIAKNTHVPACDSPGAWVARLLLGEPLDWSGEDPSFDPIAFEKHVRHVWTTQKPVSPVRYMLITVQRQAGVDFVQEQGGETDAATLRHFYEDAGFNHANVYLVTRPPAQLERTDTWRHGGSQKDSRARCITCPTCGQFATGVLAVPEVPDWLLCLTCLRAPSLPDLVFPSIYRTLSLENQNALPGARSDNDDD